MLGMSAPEWSVYMRDELQVDRDPGEIDAEVVRRLLEGYRERLPLLPGAREAVERLAARWPLGLASSSNLEVIEVVMESGGFAPSLQDLGLLRGGRARQAGARRLPRGRAAHGRRPRRRPPRSRTPTTASSPPTPRGWRSIALPNHEFPPGDDALARADVVLGSARRADRRGD